MAVAAEPAPRETPDAELLGYAVAERRTLVTNNVVDFESLRRGRTDAGVCTTDAVTAAGGVLWLVNSAPDQNV